MRTRTAATQSAFSAFARRARITAHPHWKERVAAGVGEMPSLTADEEREIIARRRRIQTLRAPREAARATTPQRAFTRQIRWRGVPVTVRVCRSNPATSRVVYCCDNIASFRSPRAAVRALLVKRKRVWRYRSYALTRSDASFCLRALNGDALLMVVARPTRQQLADAIRAHRATQPSRRAPDTLGWRAWVLRDGRLVSPHQDTVWDAPELRAEAWSDEDAVRGVAGIHARRMPRDWRRAGWPEAGHQEGAPKGIVITGVVERFGRYVLGTTGWRAEWVVIRELQAPDVASMLALMQAYPDVKVHLREGGAS